MPDSYATTARLLDGTAEEAEVRRWLTQVGMEDWQAAYARLQRIAGEGEGRREFAECLPMLLASLEEAATPDRSLQNLERFVDVVPDRRRLFAYLREHPRAIEILIKLFVNSEFLTGVLLRNPEYLEQLTQHKRLAEFKSRDEFYQSALEAMDAAKDPHERLDALRRYQRWELLRIGACDTFGLMDLKSVTLQLSLLADAIVQRCLDELAPQFPDLDISDFVVLAMGKLGGEELNYSSDIDLVFVARDEAQKFWGLGQQLLNALRTPTAEGFLYRTDMRLRPWGRSGELVTSVASYERYLRDHGRVWEKQALLKARPIAGNLNLGRTFLDRVQPLIYGMSPVEVRDSIRNMRRRIEEKIARLRPRQVSVKGSTGAIRDIEFVTQYLQLIYGGRNPIVRSFNTLDALARLADFGYFGVDEYRQLSTGYVLLRKTEHALQLLHNRQEYFLPDDPRELSYLARRMDFSSAEHFQSHFARTFQHIREIYDRYLGPHAEIPTAGQSSTVAERRVPVHAERMGPSYAELFTPEEVALHAEMFSRLSAENVVELQAERLPNDRWRLTLAGFDHPGDLSMIAGLLVVYGFDIEAGDVFTDDHVEQYLRATGMAAPRVDLSTTRKFVNVFVLRAMRPLAEDWRERFEADLEQLLAEVAAGRGREARAALAARVADGVVQSDGTAPVLLPVEISIDNRREENATVMEIEADDTFGFLYELTNALALAGMNLQRVSIRSRGRKVADTLYVTDAAGRRIEDPDLESRLRATVVLIKHFTHLLPRSPNPKAALLRFHEFLEQLFQQPNWAEELASLQRPDVLDALARLLGVSDFLWEDFLRLQHQNLFPVVADIDALRRPRSREDLETELYAALAAASDLEAKRRVLNEFKDREMFRVDMRHILGHTTFGEFSRELTTLAEVVVEGAYRLCREELERRHGRPMLDASGVAAPRPCRLAICALGKCGGMELGFASDIELMFVYEGAGRTTGAEPIGNAEFFQRLVEAFTHTIRSKREGIFQIDLRLRPYGSAGPLAVALDAFKRYFGPSGDAWPYERQALVRLRAIAGDEDFGQEVEHLRDELIYTGQPFDVAAMRAMREKQIRQLVQAGTVNAKLSPGGMVDCEYFVQGLQITYGHRCPRLRTPNWYQALCALRDAGIIDGHTHHTLAEAYFFLRRLVNALRMVRGHARDLAVPPPESEECRFLARRLGYRDLLTKDSTGAIVARRTAVEQLWEDLNRHMSNVHALQGMLDRLVAAAADQSNRNA